MRFERVKEMELRKTERRYIWIFQQVSTEKKKNIWYKGGERDRRRRLGRENMGEKVERENYKDERWGKIEKNILGILFSLYFPLKTNIRLLDFT